jgi:hypothetical protein
MRIFLILLGVLACSDHNLNAVEKPTPGTTDTGEAPCVVDTGERPVEEWCSVEDNWKIPESHATDILFSLDSSCSMGLDIWQLYGNFDSFLNELSNFSENWQMMVVNKDSGCNHSGILRPTTTNLDEKFKDALFALNFENEFTEALLTVNANAVEKTGNGGCNQGFLRPNAMLHIIDITDEPEQSDIISGETWDQLVDRIVVAKGDPVLTTISAIAGDVPDGCDDASAGTGYAEAVAATNGVFLSICQDWSSKKSLGLLAAASINQDTFGLSEVPVESTIKVWITGTQTTNWVYDSQLNAIVIQGKPPGANDRVRVRYQTVCTDA